MKNPYNLPLILLIAISWTVTDKASGQSSSSAFTPETDTLYVSNAFGDAPVKGFNAKSGVEEISFVSDANAPISGQHGVLQAGGELILVNQNAGQDFAGDIQQVLLRTGTFAGFLVPHENNPDAPFAPDAAVLIKGILFVSNLTAEDPTNPNLLAPGSIYVFKGDGKLLRKLDPPSALGKPFHPRGMVLNPRDGLLYVSNCPNAFRVDETRVNAGNGGQVLKFDPSTLEFKGIFIDDPGGVNRLNRPDGLVFGPNGNLYVTSFRSILDPAKDTDSIRVYNPGGQLKESIPLYEVGQPRAFAQAILFGPDGMLFVPISGGGPSAGEVRRYDVRTKKFEVFVKTGKLANPEYLTFGRTDPATLSYDFEDSKGHSGRD
jgi:DNA-binding beta-propeller fold protein YncE